MKKNFLFWRVIEEEKSTLLIEKEKLHHQFEMLRNQGVISLKLTLFSC